ncbi:MAG TPA: PBP1A family penicillin-binding protein [Thermoanaerobaculia bacterium]|nr:PBP1A family penicillin-binding protein [Thermoanaerobaculia bacterium]
MPGFAARSARIRERISFDSLRLGRTWRRFAIGVVAAAAGGALAGVGVATAIHVPSLDAYVDLNPRLITRLLDRQGEVFATYARERRQLIEEGQLPVLLQNAVLAAEDAGFYRHGGVDLTGIVRSVALNAVRGRRAFGASTITMQLARTMMGRREKTWDRKIAETLLAVDLEKRFSKQQILTLYCNLMFLGHGNYGMEAAARDYFGHGVDEITLVEAATLAGILQRPSDFSPYRRPERVVERRDYVLRRMLEEGFISQADHRTAVATPLELAPTHRQAELAPYFAEEVRQNLERELGTERLYGEGLRVATTLDATIQRAAEHALREGLLQLDRRRGWRGSIAHGNSTSLEPDEIERLVGRNPLPGEWVPGLIVEATAAEARVRTPDGEIRVGQEGTAWTGRKSVREVLRDGDIAWFRPVRPEAKDGKEARAPFWALAQEPAVEGAVVVLESATGAVRALVGGWDFQRNKFDRATQAHRQVGSAFKPFVYGAAFENGFTPADTLFDAPAVFLGADGLPSYAPRNYYRRYYGVLTLRRALELSVNVTSVKLLDLVGVDKIVDFARRCGIQSALPPYPSLALGSADLIPLEVAAAYAAIANQGVWVRPHMIEEVRRRDGAVLSRHRVEATRAMEPAVAYVLSHVLEGVVDRGTAGSIAGLEAALAGKTGTTNDYTDAWFVGFTPRHTILAWVGYDQKKTLGKKMTGATAALPIWRSVAEAGIRDGWISKEETFSPPSGVELRAIEPHSGLAARPGAPRVFEESFLAGTAPARAWEPRWQNVLALPWTQQLAFYTPRAGERMPDFNAVYLAEQLAANEATFDEAAGD